MAFSIATGWVLVQLFVFCNADSFLQRAEDKYINKVDVERAFLEFSESNSSRLLDIEAELRPMFVALPKNTQGNVVPIVLRYALHRFFVQKHGWYMAGLDPAGGAIAVSSTPSLMKDRAPAYIHSLFEGRLQDGLSLRDMAVFAAVLSDLVHSEVSGEMLNVYTFLRLPTVGPVAKHRAEDAFKAYLLQFFMGGIEGEVNITDMESSDRWEKVLVNEYPDWKNTYRWVRDFRMTREFMHEPRTNPFVPQRETFDKSVALAKDLWHSFGSFQDLECRALKGKLVKLEQKGTGRVSLAKFFEGSKNGDWTLAESADYLRNLGALDETDPKRRSVIIPNYITSKTNCLSASGASGFYSVCCSNECNALLQHIEKNVANHSTTPSRIIELVSALPSDTVYAPRELSNALLRRLDSIADANDGRIPIHGRLFAQWMHHAYPRECPFPHVSGTFSPMAPREFMRERGMDSYEATEAEIEMHTSNLEEQDESPISLGDLPWTHVEELVAGYDDRSQQSWLSSTWLRVGASMVALASFAVPLLRSLAVAISEPVDTSKPKARKNKVRSGVV